MLNKEDCGLSEIQEQRSEADHVTSPLAHSDYPDNPDW